MSEISKGALTSENNSSFPNNNTGYITPTILRTFNQDMIDSLVDEISYTADSASVNTKITQLENFSSSLDATFATDAQLTALSTSIAVTDLAQSTNIAALQSWSSSLDNDYVSETQFNAYTSSQTAESASFNTRINALDPTGSAQAILSLNAATASLYAYTASNDAKWNTLGGQTGSYATTGSNNFIGNQNITGAVTSSTLQVAGLNYPTADNGAKSFLQTDGAGNLSLQYVDAVFETIRNMSGATLAKGTPVYISGSTGDNGNAYVADASDSNKMPAMYIVGEDLAIGATGIALACGLIEGVNTTGYAAGTEIYVAEGGGWSANRPTGSASIVQKLGVVTKEGNGGQGVVINQLQAELPNLLAGYTWVGNGTNQPTAVATSSLSVASAAFATIAQTASFVESASFAVNAGLLDGKDSTEFATTGSNTFIGDEQIVGVIQASDTNVGPQWFGPVKFQAVGNTSTGVAYDQFVNGGNYDALHIETQLNSGTIFQDTNGATLQTWMQIPANSGANPAPQFKRGLGVTGSVNISGSFRAIVPQPASIGTTTNLFASTASVGTQTSLNLSRVGGGANDVQLLQFQILSGSSTTGDTLQAVSTLGVTNNTSTFMTGSSVNNGMTSTWATGSGGGRVAYTAAVATSAQSGSAAANIIANTIKLGSSTANVIHATGSLRVSGSVGITGSFSARIPTASNESQIDLFKLPTFVGANGTTYPNATISLVDFASSGIDQTFFIEYANADYQKYTALQLGPSISSFMVGKGSGYNYDVIELKDNNDSTSTARIKADTINLIGATNVSGSTLSLNNNGSTALKIFSGSVEVTSPQGTGYFYTNLPITSSKCRINGDGIIADLFVSGVFSGNSTLNVAGNSYFTGSVFTSASVNGVVTTVTTSSNTASLDFSKGNSFTVQLVSGSNTHIFPTNIQTGQTVNVKVNTVAGAGVTFQSTIKQVSGSGYVPTPSTGVDILTMVTFDTTSDVYLANVKNLI